VPAHLVNEAGLAVLGQGVEIGRRWSPSPSSHGPHSDPGVGKYCVVFICEIGLCVCRLCMHCADHALRDEVMAKLNPLENDPEFEPDAIKKGSVAACGICKWVPARLHRSATCAPQHPFAIFSSKVPRQSGITFSRSCTPPHQKDMC
jgi:hypothetical protein